MVENLPANAGDTGSSLGLGRSHMPWSNKPCEPKLLSLRVWSLCSATREATIVRGLRTAMKSDPRLPQLEKALAQKRRPNIAINQSINQSLKKKKRNMNWFPVTKTLPYLWGDNTWNKVITNRKNKILCYTVHIISAAKRERKRNSYRFRYGEKEREVKGELRQLVFYFAGSSKLDSIIKL